MATKNDPRFKILLSRDPNFAEEDEARKNPVRFTPGETIFGRLDFSSDNSFQIQGVSVFLEGTSRNWIATAVGNEIILDVEKAEHKFLSQTLDCNAFQINQAEGLLDGYKISIPFHFIISIEIPSADHHSPDHCLQLPPSIELGSILIDDETKKRYAQPSINYALRAVVSFDREAGGTATPIESVERSVPIVLLPHTKEYPPTDTSDFPEEFVLRESKLVKWSSFRHEAGTLVLSIREPQPISYDATATNGHTQYQLDIEFKPLGLESSVLQDSVRALQNVKLTISSLIRIKTFYSVKIFPRLPSQTLLSANITNRMRDEVQKLEKQEISHLRWEYRYNDPESPVSDEEHDESISPIDASSISRPPRSLQLPDGKLKACIKLPIRAQGRFLPTFCSSLAARLYTIVVRVRVSGMRKEYYDLEAPLQIIHTYPDAVPRSDASANGLVEDPNISMGIQRVTSMASWFSEDSLDETEEPPDYHP